MQYNFSKLKEKIGETETWLKNELMGVQTGRATPAILDNILVDSYGAKVRVKEVASISIEDPRTLRVQPWDTDMVRAVEVAIRDSGLGFGVSVDEKGLRIAFPELTGETREKYLKIVSNKLEDARVSLRNDRDSVWADIQKKEKDGEITEDERFRFKDEMEKLIKEGNEKLDEVVKRKETEIRG